MPKSSKHPLKAHIKGLNICAPRRQNLLHHKRFLQANGHIVHDDPLTAEVLLVWTCGFRADVVENSINELNRCQREYPGEVIALGCLPDIDRRLLQSGFSGPIVPWKKESTFLETYFGTAPGAYDETWPVFQENAVCQDAAAYRRQHRDADVIFADQFFKLIISQGCPYHCTYCTEKLAFPPFKSHPVNELIEACRVPVEQQGQHRIMLIADCLGQYGIDIGSSLPQLIRRLKKAYSDLRFALQNLHPKNFLDIFGDMTGFIRNDWIAHINLPVQSGSDRILKAMGRQYTLEDLNRIFDQMKTLKFEDFDTHIIVGFPSESESDFVATLDFLRRHRPRYALVSKYYDAPTAPSFQLQRKVEAATMAERLNRIETEMADMGMIYNIDGADFMKDRLSRINRKNCSV